MLAPYELLEHGLAAWCGRQHTVVCSSGTAALHLALETLQLPLGCRVAVPDFSFAACARAVVLAGHVPVLVDVDSNLLMDIEKVPDTCQALIAVHTYGRLLNMNMLHARVHNVHVVEDLAEAHGVHPHPLSYAACWSFHMSKIVNGEEGGAVAFNDRARAELAKRLRTLGNDGQYNHVPRGHNYRLANVLAQQIRMSLHYFGREIDKRWKQYTAFEALCPPEWRMLKPASPWVYTLRIPGMPNDGRNIQIARLNEAGVRARHPFQPMHVQPEFRGPQTDVMSQSAAASREVIVLPLEANARKAFYVLCST